MERMEMAELVEADFALVSDTGLRLKVQREIQSTNWTNSGLDGSMHKAFFLTGSLAQAEDAIGLFQGPIPEQNERSATDGDVGERRGRRHPRITRSLLHLKGWIACRRSGSPCSALSTS